MARPLTEAEFITLFVGGGSHTNTAPQPLPTAKYTFLPHPAYCFSDASHLVACNPGDAIRFFYDPSANAYFEQPTSGNRLILRQTGSKYYAESTGSAYIQWSTMSGLTKDITLGAAYQFYSNIGNQMVFSDPVAQRELRQNGGSPSMQMIINNGSQGINDNGSLFAYNTDLQSIEVCGLSGSTASMYLQGTSVGSSADTSTGNMVQTAIAGRPDGSYCMNGRIYGVSVFQVNPDVPTLQNWLRGLQP